MQIIKNEIVRCTIIITQLFITTCIFAQTCDIRYSSGDNFKIAAFRFRISETENKVRALLVIVPGYNYDGRKDVSDSLWTEFALKNNLAVAACYFKDYKNPEIFYREASKGSGKALLNAIGEAAVKTGHPEIENVPLILWGKSAGGQFNYEFACWKPDKVLSFAVNKGGYYHTAIAPEATRKIPAIFFTGENDLYYRNDLIKGIYSVNRKLGATWTLLEEKNTGHSFGASKLLAVKYFETIIPLRLSPRNKLADLSEKEHFLGDWKTKTIQPGSDIKNTDKLTVWLPNHEFAKIWKKQFE